LLQPNLGTADTDRASLQFYDTISAPTLATGTFDLSAGKDNNFSTCQHCLLAYEDVNATAPVSYFQKSGSLKIDAISSPVDTEVKASLTDVTLVEVTIDSSTYTSTPVANGRCLHIASLALDTSNLVGTDCTTATDCGNTDKKACDPATSKCAATTCAQDSECTGTNQKCFKEVSSATKGICADGCTPAGANTCTGTLGCSGLTSDGASGVCVGTGTATEGATCTSTALNTGCAAGLTCAMEGADISSMESMCRKNCDAFAADTGCPSGKLCQIGFNEGTVNPVCSDNTVYANTTALNAACGASASPSDGCAPDATGYRGLCVEDASVGSGDAGTPSDAGDAGAPGDAGSQLICHAICRVGGTDCTAPATCQASPVDYGDGTIGVCM
jgi:hypothetical protein